MSITAVTEIADGEAMSSVRAKLNETINNVSILSGEIDSNIVEVNTKLDITDGSATRLGVSGTLTLNGDPIATWADISTRSLSAGAGITITENVISALPDYSTINLQANKLTVVGIGTSSVATSNLIDSSVTSGKIAANAVTTEKILAGTVTKAKIEPIANSKVLGNASGSSASPSELSIITDPTLSGAADTNLPSTLAAKTYTDRYRMRYSGETIWTGPLPAQGSDAVVDLAPFMGGVSARAWVHVRVLGGNGTIWAQIKENGTPRTVDNWYANKGTSQGSCSANTQCELSCITDADGKIQVAYNQDPSSAGGSTSSLVLLCYQFLD